MKFTWERLIWILLLAGHPIGWILLIFHFWPRWKRQDEQQTK